MLVQILPLTFEYGEQLTIWRKNAKRGSLIDWSLASVYFRPTEHALDMTQQQEVWTINPRRQRDTPHHV